MLQANPHVHGNASEQGFLDLRAPASPATGDGSVLQAIRFRDQCVQLMVTQQWGKLRSVLNSMAAWEAKPAALAISGVSLMLHDPAPWQQARVGAQAAALMVKWNSLLQSLRWGCGSVKSWTALASSGMSRPRLSKAPCRQWRCS